MNDLITLVADTETTGLPAKNGSPLSAQPHLLQLACIMFKGTRPVGHFSSFAVSPVEPPDFIPFWKDNKLLSDDRIKTELPLGTVMKIFNQLCRKSDRVVFHNLAYDEKIINWSFERIDAPETEWDELKRGCTMKTLTPIMKVPQKNGKGIKWPTLDEAYRKYVDPDGFEDAHDAMADVQACAKVLFAIEKQGITLL